MKHQSLKKALLKLNIWFSKKCLPNEYGCISKTERDAIKIFNTIASDLTSELLIDSLSNKYYIKSIKTGVFITFCVRSAELLIINHVYGYTIKMSHRAVRHIQNMMLIKIKHRGRDLEKEYKNNIQYSLNNITQTLKERL